MEQIIKWVSILVVCAVGGHLALQNGLDNFIGSIRGEVENQQTLAPETVSNNKPNYNAAQGQDRVVTARAMRLKAGRNGHFYLNARINGANIPFVVDTGASLVALSYEDAQKAGIRPKKSDFKHYASTANGKVPMAVVVLDKVRYKGFTAKNVRTGILPKGALSGKNLLGNSFLSQLREYKVKNGTLIMIP